MVTLPMAHLNTKHWTANSNNHVYFVDVIRILSNVIRSWAFVLSSQNDWHPPLRLRRLFWTSFSLFSIKRSLVFPDENNSILKIILNHKSDVVSTKRNQLSSTTFTDRHISSICSRYCNNTTVCCIFRCLSF